MDLALDPGLAARKGLTGGPGASKESLHNDALSEVGEGWQRLYRTLLQDPQGATAADPALPVHPGTGSGTGGVSRSPQPALVD